MAQKIRIILAEGAELFRKSLIALFHSNPKLHVVAEACNGKELLEQLKHHQTDIVIMDTDMPIMDGKTTLEIIHRRFPAIRVIVLSNHSDMERQSDFMSYGANGYLCKTCCVKTLFDAIEKVKEDGYFFDNSTSIALLDSILKEKEKSIHPSKISFNDRETEIMKKICDGKTNKEIGMSLHLSPSTIDFYRSKIYGKTKCNNATGLLKFALKNGLVAL